MSSGPNSDFPSIPDGVVGGGWALALANLLWKPLLIAVLALLLMRYSFQVAQAQSQKQVPMDGRPREPVQHPYILPGVGNTISFVFNTEGFVMRLIKSYSPLPIQLFIAGEKMLLISPGELVGELFRRSKEVHNKALNTRALRDCFGMPESELGVLVDDNSGIFPEPLPGHEFVDPKSRVHYMIHRDLHTLLNGPALEDMTRRFVGMFTERLARDERFDGGKWVEMKDFYRDWLRNEMFHSAIEALCGDKFLELVPDFPEIFWEWDRRMPNLLKGIPRWIVPRSYKARDGAVEGIMKWQEEASKNFDWESEMEMEKAWDHWFGARLMRARAKMFRGSGQGPRAAAAQDLGLLWALNANAIPATYWMLVEIFRRPELLERVREEIMAAQTENGAATFAFGVDVAKLCSGPLLTSIYMEVLRLTVALTVARTPLEKGFVLGKKWNVDADTTMLCMSSLGHMDERFWGGWNDGQGHSVREFWAERFLVYPDDKKGDSEATKDEMKRTVEDDRKARLVTSGIQNHWIPYGGGIKMCPGRFFAKREVFAAVAVVIMGFEVKFTDEHALKHVKLDPTYFPFGTMPPDRNVPVRIRRKI